MFQPSYLFVPHGSTHVLPIRPINFSRGEMTARFFLDVDGYGMLSSATVFGRIHLVDYHGTICDDNVSVMMWYFCAIR